MRTQTVLERATLCNRVLALPNQRMKNEPISFCLCFTTQEGAFQAFPHSAGQCIYVWRQSHCYSSLNSLLNRDCKCCKTVAFLLMRIKQGQDKSCPPAQAVGVNQSCIVLSLPKAETEVLLFLFHLFLPFSVPPCFVWDIFPLMGICFQLFFFAVKAATGLPSCGHQKMRAHP